MESEAAAAPLPTAGEARAWVGKAVDDLSGSRVGKARGLFADAQSGDATWLVAKLGRFTGPLVAIPLRDCAAGGDRIWVAHQQRVIRGAPVVDPSRVLLREHELTIAAHFGIGKGVGRGAEVAGRPAGSITSRPA